MLSVYRILDVNANRAREALRVMEDHARFVLDDSSLSQSLKILRHDLRTALDLLPPGVLEANRDAGGDVGRGISTEAELQRDSAAEVAVAAGKRLGEALRSLEEHGKTVSAPFAQSVGVLRFRGYELEQALHLRSGAGARRKQWKLCVLLTEALCTHRSWLEVLEAALAGGADCIQLREKSLDDGKLLGRATVVVNRCREAGAAAIINDRADIALAAGADGVHLGQHDLPVGHVRKIAGRGLIIGVSTASLIQAQAAQRMGADYCGVGPMFATTTKEKPVIAGPAYLREYLQNINLPHLAIGGISVDRLAELVEAGVRGVAVSSAVCGAQHPQQVCRELRALLPRD